MCRATTKNTLTLVFTRQASAKPFHNVPLKNVMLSHKKTPPSSPADGAHIPRHVNSVSWKFQWSWELIGKAHANNIVVQGSEVLLLNGFFSIMVFSLYNFGRKDLFFSPFHLFAYVLEHGVNHLLVPFLLIFLPIWKDAPSFFFFSPLRIFLLYWLQFQGIFLTCNALLLCCIWLQVSGFFPPSSLINYQMLTFFPLKPIIGSLIKLFTQIFHYVNFFSTFYTGAAILCYYLHPLLELELSSKTL